MSLSKTPKTKSGKKARRPKRPKPEAAADGGQKPQRAGEPRPEKLSALDAASRVLSEAGRPMNSREIVEQMAAQGLWSSPKGKTPPATVNAAIGREINTRGKDSRFKKVGPGQFSSNVAK